MNVESTLGGFALSADGSSWPDEGLRIVSDIMQLPAADGVKTMMMRLACGILEAHLSLKCMGLVGLPFVGVADPDDRTMIRSMKEKRCKPADSLQDVAVRFAEAQQISVLLTRSYLQAIDSLETPDKAALVDAIQRVLDAQRVLAEIPTV